MFSISDILKNLKEPELSQYTGDFLRFFEEGDLERGRNFSILCDWILQVQALFDDLMSPNQKVRFREIIKGFLQATVEEHNMVLISERAGRVERFLEVRYHSSFYEFF